MPEGKRLHSAELVGVPLVILAVSLDDLHYITLFVLCRVEASDPKNLEPEKCEGG